ncbi:hypothetical protein F0919_12060 [Taibaiella lutea]|uniref:Uncharacterized protein n=1 Tax=Taibaiella lutea TaxID=2608001 RepID=A0A5M6CIQ2_9BACT|nr:hypothetical protein [Taibaiella lutea]KAA5533275.1 hypothetical protein F0919_12060 [Taibaiella lutea]
MKNLKIISLLAGLLFLLGFTANAQNNTFSRSLCNPNFQGCSNIPLTLELHSQGQFPIANSKSVNAPSSGVTFHTSLKRIYIHLGGYTSSGYYTLPTTIGEGVIISLGAEGEGVGPYTVYIYKTGNYQFSVSVGYMAY